MKGEKIFDQVVQKGTDRFQTGRFNLSLMRARFCKFLCDICGFAAAEEETLDKNWIGLFMSKEKS